MATLWSAVLGVQPVGVTDGFLDLGGYSSLAVALLARVEEEFGRRLPLAALFAEPTVAHMAQLLNATPATNANDSLVPLRAGGTLRPLFCVHPAGGTVFCYLDLRAAWQATCLSTGFKRWESMVRKRRTTRSKAWLPITSARCDRCSPPGHTGFADGRPAVTWRSRSRDNCSTRRTKSPSSV